MPSPRTLEERACRAEADGYGMYSAATVHMLSDKPLEDSHLDPFYATLVVATTLFYLYTRRWDWALLAFAVYYVLETAVFLLAKALHGHVGRYLHKCESRLDELLTDPVVFGLALFAAHFIFSGSGLLPPLSDPLGALAVVPGTLFLMATRTYWAGVVVPTLAAWVYFWATGSAQPTLPLLSTATSLYFGAWFVRPINHHFMFNALYALLVALMFVSLLVGISAHPHTK